MELPEVQAVVDDVANKNPSHRSEHTSWPPLDWPHASSLHRNDRDPIELLRITAFGASNDAAGETGERLTDFAKTLAVLVRGGELAGRGGDEGRYAAGAGIRRAGGGVMQHESIINLY